MHVKKISRITEAYVHMVCVWISRQGYYPGAPQELRMVWEKGDDHWGEKKKISGVTENLQRIVHTVNSSHNGISNSCVNWRQYWLTTVIATCSLMHLLSLESWKPRGWFPAALGVRCSPAKIQKQKYIQKLGCNYTIFQENILIYVF